MTPTRAIVGLAAAAAVGYAVINTVHDDTPQYVGDFPSIAEQAGSEAPPVPSDSLAPPVPDPPHYDANPVVPEASAAPPAGPAGPGPVGPAAPPGGGGTGGQGGYPPPSVGNPLAGPLGGVQDLLNGLLGSLPTFDPTQICRDTAGQIIATVPCDQIPVLPTPPEIPPVEVPPLP